MGEEAARAFGTASARRHCLSSFLYTATVLPPATPFPQALTSTAKPSRARYIAAVLPAGPAPTTTAFLPAYSVEGATAVAVVEGTEAEDAVPPGAAELKRRREKSEGA